jgi:serine/threonine protein kinase
MPDSNPGLMTIFTEAQELSDPSARAVYLEHACGGDADLRGRVEALLAADAGSGRFLKPDATGTFDASASDPAEARGTSSMASPAGLESAAHLSDGVAGALGDWPRPKRGPTPAAGTVIAGRYTLVDVIGEGGMGSVYLASQTEPVKRQVALKLIKAGMDSKAVLARFDAERQALALMDHPNIARVYDGGTTPSGQQFFVMELVDGVPITNYCDQRRVPVEARLELFVHVCHAVQHAHQKGIIHRDLKPSNVLITEVDGQPTPKVIDFGVAKAIELKLTDLSFADAGAIVGTPAYMSPEQADPSSMDIDTRTDVYALGVILYELLTGSPPLDDTQFRRGAILEMLRMVREVEPPKPSTKVSTAVALPSIAATRGIEPGRLKRALRGDLDWIVMKALEKDRTRRYETSSTFAADVRRFLAGEPIEARPPSNGYRLKKFVKRNRVAVLTSGAMVLMMVVGTTAATWQAIRATRAERTARAEEENAIEARDRAEKAEELARARLVALTVEKQRADEEAIIAKTLNEFTREKIWGEHRAAMGELGSVLDQIVDVMTAQANRAKFVEAVRRMKRANDMLRSLADKISNLPKRSIGAEEKAFLDAVVKESVETSQKMFKMVDLAQKYPKEMLGMLSELNSLMK